MGMYIIGGERGKEGGEGGGGGGWVPMGAVSFSNMCPTSASKCLVNQSLITVIG